MRIRLCYYTYFLLCYLLFSSPVQSQLRKLYLHPKTIAREKQTKFIDSLRFIPLEIKDGIQLGSFYNIQVTQKFFLLTDHMNKRLLLYSKDGHFVKNINYNRLGGNFYPSYRVGTNEVTFFGNNKNYTLTPKDQIKIRLDWNNQRNKKYFKKYILDLNDSLLTIKKAIPNEKDVLQVSHFYDDYYVQATIKVSPLFSDSLDHELKIYKDNQLVKSFFPYNRINEPRFLFTEEGLSANKTDTANIHFINRPYCDTVYKMIGDSLFPVYKLVLPLENTLPVSFYSKPFKNKTERENFARNNGWVMKQVYEFYETPRFIFFSVGYLSNFDSYIYEKQNDVIYKTKNIKADSSHYNLQLVTGFGIVRNGNTFYKTQKASDLLTFFEQHKNAPIPKELEPFIESKPAANTPVIVAFKFKTKP